jgi:C1A family cysteine protease
MKPILSLMLLACFPLFLISQQNDPKNENEKSFPPQYDLRSLGYVSSVKDQGSCGCCWAFATMAAVESNWLKNGYGSFDLSEDNLINCQRYDYGQCDGGNFYMSSSMFGRHAGPVLESLDPYGDTTGAKFCPGGMFGPLRPTAYIPDVRFLPGDINTIKQALQDHGAVAATMYWNNASYNAMNFTYLYNGVAGAPHCVTVVGWDDNMITASANPGAWIIKDSYGTGWANQGYFYISYDDPALFTEAAIFPTRYPITTDTATYVYYYDEFGWINNTGFSSTTGYGLTHHVIGGMQGNFTPQQIKYIGTYAVEENTNLEVEIYENFDGTNLSGLRYQTSMFCDFAGFYTIPVSMETDTAPTDVYVKVKYETSSGIMPIPVEEYEAGYTTNNLYLETGVNWISPDGNNWTTVGFNTPDTFDLCIKMYTERAPLASFTMQDTAMIGEPVMLTSTSIPVDRIDSLRWLLEGAIIGTEPSFIYSFFDPGDNLVKLVAYIAANSDTAEKCIYIKDPQLLSIIPDHAMQGDMVMATITGSETDWLAFPPAVNLINSSDPGEQIPGLNVTVIDKTTLTTDFDIPPDASTGQWDVHVDDLVLDAAFEVEIYVGLTEHQFSSLNIYPNPSDGKLFIDIGEQANISLWNLNGKHLGSEQLQQGTNTLTLDHLPNGIYILKVFKESKISWYKVLFR